MTRPVIDSHAGATAEFELLNTESLSGVKWVFIDATVFNGAD